MSNLIENRQIRVFISSTFRDMQDERDYLMKRTFPMLRKLAAERDVTLTELDLRWGITEEEAKSGKVVEICLREIENSIPFFIGIIGNRYGWVPEKKDIGENVTERFKDVNSYLERHLSVTEMEMQFGVLQRKEDMHAYFYIKEGEEKENADNPEMLERLKKEVKASRYPSSTYSSPEDLAQQVEKVFTALLDQLFPECHLSEMEKESIGQRSFMRHLCQNYVRDDRHFKDLSCWLSNPNKPQLIISGLPGSGKSALVANFINELVQNNVHNYEIVYCFVGSGTRSNIVSMMTYIYYEICAKYNIDNKLKHIKKSFHNVELHLDRVLNDIKNMKLPLLIVIDGINHIAGHAQCDLFNGSFQGVKLLVTKTPNYDDVDFMRKSQTYFLDSLDGKRKHHIISKYTKFYGKKFNNEQQNTIASCETNSNGHVLKSLLDELIISGTHDNLNALIGLYCSASNTAAFFQLLLEQYEKDFGCQLVRDVLCLMAVSHNGLTEDEIISTVSCPLAWSQLYARLSNQLYNRNGLISFSNSFFFEAIINKYLNNKDLEDCYRNQLVQLLQTNDSAHSKLEIAYQLSASSKYEELYQFVVSPYLFNVLSHLKEYWKVLISNGNYSLSAYYHLLWNDIKNDPIVLKDLSLLCMNLEDYRDALLYLQARLHLPNLGNEEIAFIYADIADSFEALKDYTSSIENQLMAIRAFKKEYNANNGLSQNKMAYLFKRISILYGNTSNHQLELDYKSKEIEIRSLTWDNYSLAMYIIRHAEHCYEYGFHEEALKWAKRAVSLLPDNEYCMEMLQEIQRDAKQ